MRELIRDTVFSRLAWLADEFSERPALWQGEHKINYRELTLARLSRKLPASLLDSQLEAEQPSS